MRLCPCGTELSYASCCAPLHRGEREGADAEALMRSRFAAFALKQTAYLWRTLHREHEDRSRDEREVVRELKAACDEHRYLGLKILETSGPDGDGVARVLFAARVFRRGKDLSFVERSEFLHDGVGWRYVRGEAEKGES